LVPGIPKRLTEAWPKTRVSWCPFSWVRVLGRAHKELKERRVWPSRKKSANRLLARRSVAKKVQLS